MKKNIDSMMERMVTINAVQANNLNVVLSPKWTEGRNVYKIVSKIENRTSMKRLNDMIENRYIA
jgi:hypothetical protein